MIMRSIASLVLGIFCIQTLCAQNPDIVIPIPAEVIMSKGNYSYNKDPEIKVTYMRTGMREEEYELSITPKGVKIKAATPAGAFYAMQTLNQITCDGTVKEIRCCTIKDSPRFPYRGLHVDVSRHFRSVEFLKKQMDAMARF